MRILVVEQDAGLAELIRRAVASLGHESITARGSIEAWDYLRTSTADVVLAEWHMPAMDGVELCRRLRERTRNSPVYTYFILLLPHHRKDQFLHLIADGVDDYLPTPIDPVDFQARLHTASVVSALHARLHAQAGQDPLTELGNRRRMEDDLASLRARSIRYGHAFAVALCDVDAFQPYLQKHGQEAADEVIRSIARALAGRIRSGDAIYRFSNQEMLVVLPGQNVETATIAAHYLRTTVDDLRIPHDAKQPLGPVTVSIGVAELEPLNQKSVDALLEEARTALTRAKEGGGDQVVAVRSRPH